MARFFLEVPLAIDAILLLLFTLTYSSLRVLLLKFLPQLTGTPGATRSFPWRPRWLSWCSSSTASRARSGSFSLTCWRSSRWRWNARLARSMFWLEETLIQKMVGAPVREDYMRRLAMNKKASGYLDQILTEDEHPIMHFLITLPLNFVPVVGNVLFCFLNSFPTAIGLHPYYNKEMTGLSSEEFAAVVHAKKAQYHLFGFVASAFRLIPGLDIILVLTNAVGAALWAADMEKAQGSIKATYY